MKRAFATKLSIAKGTSPEEERYWIFSIPKKKGVQGFCYSLFPTMLLAPTCPSQRTLFLLIPWLARRRMQKRWIRKPSQEHTESAKVSPSQQFALLLETRWSRTTMKERTVKSRAGN